jgi:nitroreductase
MTADHERFAVLVRHAVMAPSAHNTQPWQFQVAGHRLGLRADRTRSLAVIDPDGRQLTLACGAALLNASLTVAALGFEPVVEPFPRAADPDLLAEIRYGDACEPDDDDVRLFEAIPRRATNRGRFEARDVDDEMVETLKGAAVQEGAWFSAYRAPEGKYALADLIARGDRAQFADPDFRDELAAWMRPHGADALDGIPGYGFESTRPTASPSVLRSFDMGGARAARDHDLAAASPLLAVIGTPEDDPTSWLAAGRALQRLLLEACSHGMSASFLDQAVEVPELRGELRDLVGLGGFPQVLVRLGHGTPAARTPRRPLAEVLL